MHTQKPRNIASKQKQIHADTHTYCAQTLWFINSCLL